MDKIRVEREAIVLDSKEKQLLRECLVYCRHRLNKHPEAGLQRCVSKRFVDYMIEVL